MNMNEKGDLVFSSAAIQFGMLAVMFGAFALGAARPIFGF
jgi:hypothetical protein